MKVVVYSSIIMILAATYLGIGVRIYETRSFDYEEIFQRMETRDWGTGYSYDVEIYARVPVRLARDTWFYRNYTNRKWFKTIDRLYWPYHQVAIALWAPAPSELSRNVVNIQGNQ
jgi:hypothetical protein